MLDWLVEKELPQTQQSSSWIIKLGRQLSAGSLLLR